MVQRPLFVLLALLVVTEASARPSSTIQLTPPTRRRRASRTQVDFSRSTKELPCRWKLPKDWKGFRRPLEDDGVVVYISGTDPSVFARVYSWPAKQADRAQEAQEKLLAAWGEPVLLDIVVPWRDEIHLHMWSSTEGDIRQMNFQKLMPDVAYVARVTRFSNRLLAAVVGVRKPEDPQAQPIVNAKEILDRLEWKRPWTYGGFARTPRN